MADEVGTDGTCADSNQPAGGEASGDDNRAQTTEQRPPDQAMASLEASLAETEARAEEHWNKYLRTAAELDNVRKRAARDVENARKYGVEHLAGDLLEVIDSLEMGIEAAADASAESLLEGKRATLKILRAALSKAGVEQIDPAGEPFNPELHEAMTTQPSADLEPGSVITVVQKGYQLNGRLLRPARVIVSRELDS
jgi:molecular chaperone GrpE